MESDSSTDGRKRSFIEEARRNQIVDAATETVAEVGYVNASLARIAERAGISKSVISYHFDGKDELLEQVVKRYFEDAWEHMKVRFESAETERDRIKAWVEDQVGYFVAHRTGFLAMAEIVGNHRGADGTRMLADEDQDDLEAVSGMLRDGQDAGEFREFDPIAIAKVINWAIEGALSRWAYFEEGDLGEQIPALADFILHAIEKEKS